MWLQLYFAQVQRSAFQGTELTLHRLYELDPLTLLLA
jgi:hypothetical protein